MPADEFSLLKNVFGVEAPPADPNAKAEVELPRQQLDELIGLKAAEPELLFCECDGGQALYFQQGQTRVLLGTIKSFEIEQRAWPPEPEAVAEYAPISPPAFVLRLKEFTPTIWGLHQARAAIDELLGWP